MRNMTLSHQVSFLVAGLMIAFTAIIWIPLFSISLKMNDRAASESVRLMQGRIGAIQEQLGIIASDYHNWTDVYIAAKELDFDALSSNYGITAERGDVFQFSQIFDGPFGKPISWRNGHGLDPQPGFLDAETLNSLRHRVESLNVKRRETFNFFAVFPEGLVTFSASYLLPEAQNLLNKISIPKDAAIAVIGRNIDSDILNRVAADIEVTDLNIIEETETDYVASLPLLGVDGSPIANLVWQPPFPGSKMMMRLTPLMAVINVCFLIVAILADRMLSNSARRLIQREIETANQARKDNLTGMPNRLSLLEHLTEISSQEHFAYAVIALDLDRFKQINDSVGHHGGDAFLIEFSRQLQFLRGPSVFISRSGGDEFFVVIHSERDLEPLVDQVVCLLEGLSMNKIECGGTSFEILASKGLAQSDSCRAPEEIMRRADRAMYEAKRNSDQMVQRYNEHLAKEDARRKDVEAALINNDLGVSKFQLFYQPIVTAGAPDSPVKYEALLRWHSTDFGKIAPEDVLSVAERTGQIVPLGWIIFDMVCNDLIAQPELHVSMNVSPAQLLNPGFALGILKRLKQLSLDPRRLEIEITENVALENDKIIARELWRLREAGVSIALDDFGKGFSSIGYLSKMPFDALKVDKAYVMTRSAKNLDLSMVKSIIGIGQALGLEVIAEGVEDAQTAEALFRMGCTHLQGFYIGQPAPLDSYRNLLTTRLGTFPIILSESDAVDSRPNDFCLVP